MAPIMMRIVRIMFLSSYRLFIINPTTTMIPIINKMVRIILLSPLFLLFIFFFLRFSINGFPLFDCALFEQVLHIFLCFFLSVFF